MMIWILGTLLVLIVIVLLLPLTTAVNLSWDQERRGVFIEFIPGIKLLKIQKSWNLQELEQDEASIVEETTTGSGKAAADQEKHVKLGGMQLRQFLWAWYWWNSKAAKRGLKRIRMQELIWETSFSTGDVALTGVATGMVWAIKGWLLTWTGSLFTLEKVRIEVWPQWDDRSLKTRFDCIVKTRLVHIIGISISAAWYFVRYHLRAK